jgi:hypothetical protein
VLVKDIVPCIEQFRTMFKQGNSFKAEYSKPWHFNKSYKTDQVPFAKLNGVYIYSKPASPDWNVPIYQNEEVIWYIGKSAGGIGARVWQHMGSIFEPGTEDVCKPRFKYHQWANDDNVPDDIRQSIADGNVVVYIVRIEPDNFNPLVVEKYLLACFYRAWGKLPILNKDI